MQPNPVLNKLGFAPDDRLAIIHADDIGMCHDSITAYADLVDVGLLSSAAVMVPCAWFPAVADYCRQNPGLDMGVHLTLTSEWSSYRWGPISTRDKACGLLDDAGYFFSSSAGLQRMAGAAAVVAEWDAQIQRAIAAGIDATHFDSHMMSAYYVPYLNDYVRLARQYSLPPMLLRQTPTLSWLELYRQPEGVAHASQHVAALEADGAPLVDYFYAMPLDWHDSVDRMEEAKHAFANLQPGITHFALHPTHDTPEIRAIAPDWRCRVSDFEIFSSRELQTFIRNEGVHVINYRVLRDVLRGETQVPNGMS